jgi:hypothetical protein
MFQPNKRTKIETMSEAVNINHNTLPATHKNLLEQSLVNPNFNYVEWLTLPEPTNIAEFLDNPYNFHPSEDFVNNTWIEVSNSLI